MADRDRPAPSSRNALRQTALDAVAGACGAVCLVAVGAPFDTAKLRMQTGAVSRNVGALGVMTSLVRAEGLLSLWKGAGPGTGVRAACLVGRSPTLSFSSRVPALASALLENVVVFASNGALRRLVAGEAAKSHDVGVGTNAALGAASGVCSSIAICPAEVSERGIEPVPAPHSWRAGRRWSR